MNVGVERKREDNSMLALVTKLEGMHFCVPMGRAFECQCGALDNLYVVDGAEA